MSSVGIPLKIHPLFLLIFGAFHPNMPFSPKMDNLGAFSLFRLKYQ